MGYMTINNRRVAFTDEKNVLSVIRKSGIDLPTFCYHSELSTYGACRMCVVEDERGKVFASCSEVPRDGMVIYTNTPRLQHHRKMIIELLLSSHCRDCTTCAKNGVCTLQKLASQLGISEIRFENHKKPLPLDTSSDCVIRDPNKCILCGDCVRTCDEIQGLGILDFAFRGSKMQVMPAFNRELAETDCVGCGQCRAVCPTGAISFIEREAAAYDEAAVKANMERKETHKADQLHSAVHRCPGQAIREFNRRGFQEEVSQETVQSQLQQWPCQIKLVPVNAPYFEDAKLLIAADCTAYAYANVHEEFMKGKITLIGCPKLDQIDYSEKLTQIIAENNIKSVTVLRMEVPCCGGLENAAVKALKNSGKFLPWQVVTISIDGRIL